MTGSAVNESLNVNALSRNLKKHFHEEYSVIVILNGSCAAWIEENEYSLKSGDVLFISPGVVHSCIPEKGSTDLSYRMAALNRDWLENFFMNPGHFKDFTSRTFILPTAIDVNKIFPLSTADTSGDSIILSEDSLSDILLSASEIISSPSNKKSITSSETDHVVDYLKNNYMKDISLDELAEISGLSKYYLIYKFKKQYGLTPYAYLTNLRINTAKYMLKGNSPIIEVALEVGFYDQSHFTNTFNQYVGISPQSYRNFIH